MAKKIIPFGLLLLGFSITAYAQLPYSFTQIARNTNFGSARGVTVATDGAVFLAMETGGLRAYSYDGATLTNTAHVNHGGEALQTAVSEDGTVFLANGRHGLWAYNYDGDTFVYRASIYDGGEARDVAIASDSTVLLANADDGLRAYHYDGNSFTPVAHRNDGGEATSLALDADGTIFLTNGGEGDGLRAYRLDGASFTNTAHIDDGDGGGVDVAVSDDGTVFVAYEWELRAYTYNGSTFTLTADTQRFGVTTGVTVDADSTVFVTNEGNVIANGRLDAFHYDGNSFENSGTMMARGFGPQGTALGSDGTIFMADGNWGLQVFSFVGEAFDLHATIQDGGSARDVELAADGTVFLANNSGGLQAYQYDGSSLVNTASVIDGGRAVAVAIASDGSVILASNDSVQAFTYSGVEFAKAACIESQYNLYIGMTADNTVFVHPLWAYRYAGNSFTKFAESTQGPGGGRAIAVAADGTIFFAHGDGLLSAYFYDGASVTYKGSSYSHPNGTGRDVALGIDGTVFLANGTDGLRAYHYHADWFQKFDEIGHINDGGAVIGLSVAHDGTVFVAADDGLRAYSWKDSVFTKIAHQDDGVSGEDIAIAPDGTVYLAAGEHGLIAYAFSKTTTIVAEDSPVPNDFALSQNYPNPFNPSTTIKFSLPKASFVTLKIYNMLGVEVATLVEGRKPAGRHAITFKATNLASGLHYYTLTAGEYRQSRKMLLLR